MSYISRRLWITRWGSRRCRHSTFVWFFCLFYRVLLSCFTTSLLCSKGTGFTINNTYLCPLVCHLPFSVHTHTHTHTAETHEECVEVFTGCKVICMFLFLNVFIRNIHPSILMFEWVRLRRPTAFATTERGPKYSYKPPHKWWSPPKPKQRGINCNGINNIANVTQFHGGHTCFSLICRLLVLISYYFPVPLRCSSNFIVFFATLPIFIV